MQQLFTRATIDPTNRHLSEDALITLYRHHLAPGSGHWLKINFVSSLDGSVRGADGRSGTINTPSDQRVFALQRAHADAIIVGASTVRDEGYRAVDLAPWQREIRRAERLEAFPLLVIIRASLDVDLQVASAAEGEHGQVMIITTDDHDQQQLEPFRAAGFLLAQLGTGRVDLASAVSHLASNGYHRLLCEGGPRLHLGLLAADLVDEECLTVAPLVVGGHGMRSTAGDPLPSAASFELNFALLADDGALFTSYHRRRQTT